MGLERHAFQQLEFFIPWKEVKVMGMVESNDVKPLLEDKGFLDEVLEAALSDPDVLSEITEDIAEELGGALEDDPTFRKRLVMAALQKDNVKKLLVRQLLQELTD